MTFPWFSSARCYTSLSEHGTDFRFGLSCMFFYNKAVGDLAFYNCLPLTPHFLFTSIVPMGNRVWNKHLQLSEPKDSLKYSHIFYFFFLFLNFHLPTWWHLFIFIAFVKEICQVFLWRTYSCKPRSTHHKHKGFCIPSLQTTAVEGDTFTCSKCF